MINGYPQIEFECPWCGGSTFGVASDTKILHCHGHKRGVKCDFRTPRNEEYKYMVKVQQSAFESQLEYRVEWLKLANHNNISDEYIAGILKEEGLI